MANPLDPVSLNETGTFAPRSSGVPGMATLLRRSRKRPKAGVSTLQVQPEGAGPCLDCQTPSQEPPDYVWPTVGPPRVPWEQVRAMPEGAELIEGGRIWARLPGGQPVKIFDGWKRGGLFRNGLNDADDGLGAEDEDLLPVQLSVNFPNYYASERDGEFRFGTADIITADLRKLGVGLVRHPGQAQLFLSNLLDGLGRGEPIPLDLMSRPLLLESTIRSSATMGNLRDLLHRLRGTEMKVMLTLLTFGGGGGAYEAEFDGTRDSPALRWSSDHQNQTLVDPWFPDEDPKPFNRATGDSDIRPALWDLETFDPDNPYKRLLYRRVCSIVAKILDEWASAETGGWIREVFAGVEIGNELDVRHKRVGAAGQEINPGPWGAFYAECAVAICQENDWLPLWLPGLTSYGTEGRPGDRLAASWWGKVDWVRELVGAIGDRLGQINSALERDWAMDDIVAGMDVHWYHTDNAAARRAVLLTLELEVIRDTLVDTLEALGTDLGGKVELTVTECGINTMCGGDPWIAAWPFLDTACDPTVFQPEAHIRPPYFISSERSGSVRVTELGYAPDILTWQAANLVLQVFCALAGGARTVGPHGHVVPEPGETSHFAGMGLREDRHSGGLPEDAWLRPSGAVLRRLAKLLQGAGEARVVHPPDDYTKTDGGPRGRNRRDVGEDLANGTYPSSNHIVVIEIENLSLTWIQSPERRGLGVRRNVEGWGYLLFIDPIAGKDEADNTPAVADVRLTLSETSANLWKLGIEPRLVPIPAAAEDEFPEASVRFDAPESITTRSLGLFTTATVRLHRGNFPILLLSEARLRVGTITEHSAS